MLTLLLIIVLLMALLIFVIFKFGLILIPLCILIGDLMIFTWLIKKIFFRKKKDKIKYKNK